MTRQRLYKSSHRNQGLPITSSQLATRPFAPEVQRQSVEPGEWSAGIGYDLSTVPILPIEPTEAASVANPPTLQAYRDKTESKIVPSFQQSPEISALGPSQPTQNKIQRVVSNSLIWPPADVGVQAQITNLDSQIAAAEAEGVTAVTANPLNNPTAYQFNYISNPNPTTWGYVVEERLNLKASAAGWSTQHRLTGARPDYYRNDNASGIEVFVDLTTQAQTANSGNHITQKLQNAGTAQPQASVAAADIYHAGLNPLGNGPGQVLQGLADDEEMLAFQTLSAAQNNRNDSEYDEEFSVAIEELGGKLPTAYQFSYKSKKPERQVIVDLWQTAMSAKRKNKGHAKVNRDRLTRQAKFKASRVVKMSDSDSDSDED